MRRCTSTHVDNDYPESLTIIPIRALARPTVVELIKHELLNAMRVRGDLKGAE